MMARGVVATVYGDAHVRLDEDGALVELNFDSTRLENRDPGPEAPPEHLAPIAEQLAAYSAGTLRQFDLRLRPRGTSFQQSVWKALVDIPFGETRSYGEIAKAVEPLGRDWTLARAVGAANGANPIMLIIPCHRVIGADGSLTGFGGGLPLKLRMLDFEQKLAGPQLSLF